jgi:hypothetical protein
LGKTASNQSHQSQLSQDFFTACEPPSVRFRFSYVSGYHVRFAERP